VEPGEALGLAAPVAVTLAGFAGVLVVFRPASVHQWSSLDRFRLRLLLSNSILPLAYSVIAIFLLTIKPPSESIWRWCSGVTLTCQIPFAIFNFNGSAQPHLNRIQRGEQDAVLPTLWHRDHDDFAANL
jgi:hypothetical protein